MTANGTQHLRREALLVFPEDAENAGHAADASTDLGEQFGGGSRAQCVQVLSTALQAEEGESIEMHHGAGPFGAGLCAVVES
jgi:hypothetical protein